MRRVLVVLGVLLIVLAVTLRLTLGGGARLEDPSGPPELPASALELVADLDYPPGNIAVSAKGRVFFTYHPDGDPPHHLMELVDGRPEPYRPKIMPPLETPLAVRIDRFHRLWVLDHARFGRGQPRLVGFDTTNDALIHQFKFPKDVAPFGSMLNDFQFDVRAENFYIADASPIRGTPALVAYSTLPRRAVRFFEGHHSVQPQDYVLNVGGRDMSLFGLVTLRIGVDSIAVDQKHEWLYFGPVNGTRLYRVLASELHFESGMTSEDLVGTIQDHGPKPNSDGLATDADGNIYITAPEHSAIMVLGPDKKLRTLVKDERLRWPDGLSFGPDGWLYVTCSALQHVLFRTAGHQRAHAPYQIYRFRPGPTGIPGR